MVTGFSGRRRSFTLVQVDVCVCVSVCAAFAGGAAVFCGLEAGMHEEGRRQLAGAAGSAGSGTQMRSRLAGAMGLGGRQRLADGQIAIQRVTQVQFPGSPNAWSRPSSGRPGLCLMDELCAFSAGHPPSKTGCSGAKPYCAGRRDGTQSEVIRWEKGMAACQIDEVMAGFQHLQGQSLPLAAAFSTAWGVIGLCHPGCSFPSAGRRQ